MFPSMFRNDPFFIDPYEHMDRMMSNFPTPSLFASPFMMPQPGRMLQLEDGIGRRHQRSLHEFPPSPFGGMLQSMNSMQSMMQNMQRSMMVPSVNAFPSMGSGSQSFHSSTVIMQNSGNGPRIIQSSSSASMGPDGVKETRKSHKDSGTGEMSMSIGHHIHDRAHIVEKSKNRRTGDQEEKQEYINLDEEEAESFNTEWMTKMSSASQPRHSHHRSVAYHQPGGARQGPYTRHPHHRRRPHTAAISYRPTDESDVARDMRPTSRDDVN